MNIKCQMDAMLLELKAFIVAKHPKENCLVLKECMETVIFSKTEKYIKKCKSCSKDNSNRLQIDQHLSFLEIIQEIMDNVNKLRMDICEVMDSTILTSLMCAVNLLIKLNRTLNELPAKIATFIINDRYQNDNNRQITAILQRFQGIRDSDQIVIDDNDLQSQRILPLLDAELRRFLSERIGEELSKVISELQNVQELIKCNLKELMKRSHFRIEDKQKLQVSCHEIPDKLLD